MTMRVAFLLLLSALAAPELSAQKPIPCEVLVPVLNESKTVVTAQAPDGREYPVFRRALQSELVNDVQNILKSGYVQESLRLNRLARNFVVAQAESGVSHLQMQSPMYLLMSTQDGGFGRTGFWLEDEVARRQLLPADYVDMVIGNDSIESGNFEEIFPHELGHLTLRALLGETQAGMSRKMHQSMTVTDYPTAFNEGYAEHFQPLARKASTNAHFHTLARGMGAADLNALWLSAADGQLRTDGVKRNLFIHAKPLPELALDKSADRYRLFVSEETTTAFLPTKLRTGQQMMASEGVIATLFYRFVNDEWLGKHYRAPQFYMQFVQNEFSSPEKEFTPYENVNLKLFAAMAKLRGDRSNRPPIVSLVEEYGKLFPDEAARIKKIFIETTWGATVSQELAARLSRASEDGAIGDMNAFQHGMPFQLLDSTIAEVVNGKRALDANIGPELWVVNSSFKISRNMWTKDRTLPLTINLNTATEAELMTIPGLDLAMARNITQKRSSQGYFQSAHDLDSVIPHEVALRVNAMFEEMKQVKPYERE